jgi:hypothetical protein
MICTACSTRTGLPTPGGRRPTNSKGRRIRDPARPVAPSRLPRAAVRRGRAGRGGRSAAALIEVLKDYSAAQPLRLDVIALAKRTHLHPLGRAR